MSKAEEVAKGEVEDAEDGCCEKIYKHLGIKHITLVLIVAIYAFIGAAVFQAIEGPIEQENNKNGTVKAEDDARRLSSQIESLYRQCDLSSQDRARIRASVENILASYQKDQNIGETSHNWDFWGSMFYATTLFTTIGYGHYAPQTDAGRVATMAYALVGIPLVLAMLGDLGKLLTRALKHPWNVFRRACARCCRKRARGQTVADNTETGLLEDLTTMDGDVTDDFDFPIGFVIVIFVLYLVLTAPVFCAWEEWSYFTSFYYLFISLTTIGLGDVVPDHPRFMLISFPLIMIGLSLISMCINLIQIRMEELKEQGLDMIEDQLGFETESSSEEEEVEDDEGQVVRRKKSRKGSKVNGAEDKDKEKADGEGSRPTTARGLGAIFGNLQPTLGIFGGGTKKKGKFTILKDLTAGTKHNTRPRNATPANAQALRALQAWKEREKQAAKQGQKAGSSAGAAVTPASGEPISLVTRRRRRGVQTDESYISQMKAEEQEMEEEEE